MTHERFYEKVYGIYGEQKFKDDVYNLKDDIKFFCAYINRNKRRGLDKTWQVSD